MDGDGVICDCCHKSGDGWYLFEEDAEVWLCETCVDELTKAGYAVETIDA